MSRLINQLVTEVLRNGSIYGNHACLSSWSIKMVSFEYPNDLAYMTLNYEIHLRHYYMRIVKTKQMPFGGHTVVLWRSAAPLIEPHHKNVPPSIRKSNLIQVSTL
jgi:hypothetical protein